MASLAANGGRSLRGRVTPVFRALGREIEADLSSGLAPLRRGPGPILACDADPIRRAHPRFVENLKTLGADVAWAEEAA